MRAFSKYPLVVEFPFDSFLTTEYTFCNLNFCDITRCWCLWQIPTAGPHLLRGAPHAAITPAATASALSVPSVIKSVGRAQLHLGPLLILFTCCIDCKVKVIIHCNYGSVSSLQSNQYARHSLKVPLLAACTLRIVTLD